MMAYIGEAFAALRANRLRTTLALLGLAVGVAAVISIQILGHATAGAMAGIFKGFSNYTFIVQPNFQNGFDQKSGLTLKQISLFTSVPHVLEAIPFEQRALNAHVGHANVQLTIAPVGGNPNFYPDPFAAGRPITPEEAQSAAPVCVLSADSAKKIGKDPSDLIGQELRGGFIRCTIVGVLQAPPQGALSFDFAPGVSIPYTLYERTFLQGSSKIYAVQLLVDDPSNIKIPKIAQKHSSLHCRMGNIHIKRSTISFSLTRSIKSSISSR